MKRESLIKLLILSGLILSFTPNLEANAANADSSKQISSKVIKSGWIIKDGKKYYVKDNGEYAKYLQTIEGKTYYFNGNGEMVTGWLKYASNNEWHYFDKDGIMVKYLKTIDGKTYYFNGNGAMITGWLKFASSNEWHYFGNNGAMQKGWLTLADKTYYLNNNGARVTGKVTIDNKEYNFDKDGVLQKSNTGWTVRDGKKYYIKDNGEYAKYLQDIEGKTYYFNGNGEMITGWLKFASSNEWHYFGQDGAMQKGWLTLGDKKYYLNNNGARVTGKVKIDNKEYNFDKDGVLQKSNTGWTVRDGKKYYIKDNGEYAKYLQTIGGKTYYFNGNGEMITGWLEFANNNEWHYFDSDGAMHKGFLKLNGKTYYMGNNGEMLKYLQTIEGKTYYFNGNGEMITGWLKFASNNEWHYFGNDGAMQKGWLTLEGKTYYFNDKGVIVKYLQDINGKTYYFNGNGEMVTGWLEFASSNEWHYFDKDGAMHKGWLTLGDKKYYFDKNGVMVTGQIEIDGEFYEFNNKGELKDNPFGEGKITNYTMNLRAKPSLNSEVLTTMAPNSKVQILGREKGDLTYYHVKYVKDGQVYYGYVSIYLNGNTAVQVYEDNKDDNYLGILSEKYESNGDPGCISSGEGDYGGKSYGAWQLSSKLGSLDNFVDWLSGQNAGFYKELTDARKLDNGSNCGAHFDKAWKDIASNHYNEFYNLQHEYTKITFYNDLIRRLKNSGDYTKVLNNFAVENVLWSTAVQHGGYGAYKIIAPLTHISDPEKFITAVYNERGRRNSSGGLVYFPNCSKAVQEAVASRYIRERNDAIRMYEDSL